MLLVIFLGLKVIHGSSAQDDLVTYPTSMMEETMVNSPFSSTHYITASYSSQYSTSSAFSSIPPSLTSPSPSNTHHSLPTHASSISSISPQSPTSSSTQTSTSGSASPSSPSESSSTFHPKSPTSPIIPTKSSKPHPASSVSPQKVIVKCGEECKSLKKRLWAAGVFAVFFGVASVVFMFLLFRQCRISRDFNDPALSRLI